MEEVEKTADDGNVEDEETLELEIDFLRDDGNMEADGQYCRSDRKSDDVGAHCCQCEMLLGFANGHVKEVGEKGVYIFQTCHLDEPCLVSVSRAHRGPLAG